MSAKDQVLELVNKFKRENYLKDKTDAMGDGLLLGANLADEANERSKEAAETTLAVQEKYIEQILVHDLDPSKDPELVDLRNGKQTAGERITEFEQRTERQMVQTNKELTDLAINVKSSPYNAKGIGELVTLSTLFNTLEEAQTQYEIASSLNDSLDWVAIQTAINSAEETTGKVLIPAGNYFLNKELVVKRGVDVQGVGRQSVLTIAHDGVGVVIDKLYTENENFVGGNFTDLSIIKNNLDRKGTGLLFNSFIRGVAEQLYIRGFEKGIDTSGASYVTSIKNSHITQNVYGIYLFMSGENLNKRGLNGGLITGNDINQNEYGIYFDHNTTATAQSTLHNHGVTITNNAIQGNLYRAIRLTFGLGNTVIDSNYFEKNSRDVDLISISEENKTTITDINTVSSDIIIDTYAMGSYNTSSLHATISNNEFADGSLTAVACGYILGLDFTGNRLNQNGIYFHLFNGQANRSTNIFISGNSSLITEPVYMFNEPSNYTIFQRLNSGVKDVFSVSGYSLNVSVSPETDLEKIPDGHHYFGVVSSGTGYPIANGSLTGFKRTGNDYQYCWQEFSGSSSATKFRRYAKSSLEWSEWLPMREGGGGSSAGRPLNPKIGFTYFDTNLKKPIWWNGTAWVDSQGVAV